MPLKMKEMDKMQQSQIPSVTVSQEPNNVPNIKIKQTFYEDN
jgi:hypothetical protein